MGSLESYGAAEADFLRDKYGGRDIRVIVADALPALEFATKFGDRIFPGLPIVHIAVAQDRLDPTMLPANVVGNFEDLDPTPTLRLALRLHPDARRLVAIRGGTELDGLWDKRVRTAVGQLGSGLSVEYLAGLPTAEVLRRVGALSKDTIVFTPGYFVDGAGEVSTPRGRSSVSPGPLRSRFTAPSIHRWARHRRRLHDALRGPGARGRRDRRSCLERHGAKGYRFFSVTWTDGRWRHCAAGESTRGCRLPIRWSGPASRPCGQILA